MKSKITLLLFALFGMISIQSCTVTEVQPANTVDNDTISEVIEVTTSFNATNNYSRLISFTYPTYASDMILVYHLYDVVNGDDVWRLLPQTYYFSNGGELDYNYDFTRYDVNLFLDANFDLNTLSSAWTQNQTFRIVIIPGYFSNKNKQNVDLTNYEKVVETFKINKIKKID
jgi:hypothetical protein